jgi:hypothetical protein
MVLAYIATHGSITALEADDALGVRRLAARVNDLRDQGYDITSEMVTVTNRRGEQCRVARYSMAGGVPARRSERTPSHQAAGLLFDTQPYLTR